MSPNCNENTRLRAVAITARLHVYGQVTVGPSGCSNRNLPTNVQSLCNPQLGSQCGRPSVASITAIIATMTIFDTQNKVNICEGLELAASGKQFFINFQICTYFRSYFFNQWKEYLAKLSYYHIFFWRLFPLPQNDAF